MPSTRRRVLRTLAGSVPLTLAGCANGWRVGGTPERTIVDTSFELGGTNNAIHLADEAQVEWHGDEDQVVVNGFIWYGSSSCNRPILGGVNYNGETDTLTVVTTFGLQTPQPTENAQGERECTPDLSGSPYTVRVTFDGGLPRHVVVKQFHNKHNTTVTEVTR